MALRYHNVYGPRMPRDTPYSGVAAIFRSALEAGRRAAGVRGRRHSSGTSCTSRTSRRRTCPALAAGQPGRLRAYNVASGEPHTIGEMAGALATAFGGPAPVVTGEFRIGDVRHVVASPALAGPTWASWRRPRSFRRDGPVRPCPAEGTRPVARSSAPPDLQAAASQPVGPQSRSNGPAVPKPRPKRICRPTADLATAWPGPGTPVRRQRQPDDELAAAPGVAYPDLAECASTMPRAMLSPSPAPSSGAGVRAGSPRNATSKTRGRCSAGIPPQESDTLTWPCQSPLVAEHLDRRRATGCAGSRW